MSNIFIFKYFTFCTYFIVFLFDQNTYIHWLMLNSSSQDFAQAIQHSSSKNESIEIYFCMFINQTAEITKID